MSELNSFDRARAITTEYCKGCDPAGVQYALERVFIQHEAALQEHKTTISSLQKTLTGLREALQALYDEQDGAPLKGSRKGWERAMKLAETALQPAADQAAGTRPRGRSRP